MKKHSARLKGLGFQNLKVKSIEFGKIRSNKMPKIKVFVLDYFDNNKVLTLRPTKGYKLESINK